MKEVRSHYSGLPAHVTARNTNFRYAVRSMWLLTKLSLLSSQKFCLTTRTSQGALHACDALHVFLPVHSSDSSPFSIPR